MPTNPAPTWALDAIHWFAHTMSESIHVDPPDPRGDVTCAMAVGIEAGVALALRNPELAARVTAATRAAHADTRGQDRAAWAAREERATDCLEATLQLAQATEALP